MSLWTLFIRAEGVGNVPIYSEKNGSAYSKLSIRGQEFEMFELFHDENEIAFTEGSLHDEGDIILKLLCEALPEKEFDVSFDSRVGYVVNWKAGFFDGEYKEWDLKDYGICDDIEEWKNEEWGDEFPPDYA